ncbi:winged helix-turn-helix transcriptional regulator [Actinomycetospora termitidis]|uniref:Helix-turn-helix domain-containing protein n=1 Tax=Actinomycetospora termitidis TaxID=3053470 RepID=A0ABT7MGE3_9PSEU|nr:helix-turn-helix domain-containing protein [Actinomycetospora sp. Odt1-22]MDL5159725.1 helix-turn-helix domain-containing protein [Actinomycetospora sp. Odt1-22]
MDRDAWDLHPDSVERALDSFLPRSAGQVMREAFYGVRRFDDFVHHTGLNPAGVSARLKQLVADDMLERVGYQEPGERRRHEYRLTRKSQELMEVVVALLGWADRWLPGPDGPTVLLRHEGCGHAVHAEARCEAGHRIDGFADLDSLPGPGARPAQGME